METQERKLRTNLDTDLLKLVAIAAMLVDHIGGAFFPEIPVFRWIGRLAFPLFCYCLTVGLLYTHDIRRYLGRLAIFAVVSQPFWILAFNADDILGNLTNWNIFFTLFLSLLAMWGLTALWGGSLEDPLALVVGGHAVNWTIFALLALPLILCRTHSGLRIPKWFFYAFYPAHLAIIALVGGCMGV